MADRQGRGGERLFIAALGIGQICCWGSLFYAFPLVASRMGPELGWSKPELFAAATIGLALSGLAAYPVGAAIDRGHGRWVMGLGAIASGLLLFAWSQVDSLPLFYAVFAGIGLTQAAVFYEPAFAVTMRRVGPDHARRAITAVTLWGGFASTVFVPLVQLLLDQLGWRGALLALGGMNILVAGGLHLAVIRPALDAAPQAPEPAAPPRLEGRRAVAWALRRPVFWLLAGSFTAFAASFSAFAYHVYPLLLERGMSEAAAVTVIAVIGPAQVAGRVAVWGLAPRAPVRIVGSLVVGIFPLALLGFASLPPDLAVMAAVALAWGGTNGILTIVRGMAVPELLTRQAYGAINGALTAPVLVAMALAPLGAAALWSLGDSYDTVFPALIAGGLLLAGCFWAAAALSGRPGQGLQD